MSGTRRSLTTGLACLALLLASAAAAQAPPPPPGPFGLTGSLAERFDALTHNDVMVDEAVTVSGLELSDRFVRWRLEEGTIAPLRTRSGVLLGGWFSGTCSFTYKPPAGIEAEAMARGSGRQAFDRIPCTEAWLLTDDPAALESVGLVQGAEATDGPRPSPWLRKQRRRARLLKRPGQRHGDLAVAAIRRALGEAAAVDDLGYLSLTVRTDELGWPAWAPERAPMNTLGYHRDPFGLLDALEVVAVTGGRSGGGDESWSQVLTSHPWEGVPGEGWSPDNLDLVSADLDLDVTTGVEPYARLTATATLTLTAREAATEVVALDLLRARSFKDSFGLPEPLGFEVQSITDFEDRPVSFLHEGGLLVVRLNSPLPPGRGEILTVRYSGDAMPRVGTDSFGLLANFPWWPRPRGHERFTWGVSICVPEAFAVAGTGTTLSSEVADGRRCERWEEPVPITFPAINVGRWQTGELEGPHGIRIRAFFLAKDAGEIDAALHETARTLGFYEELFGPYPYAELDLAESYTNMGFWQAPAGLVELSSSEYLARETMEKDLRRDFYPNVSVATLAHEIGHQWWGHVVGWKSYRDQWISETFAEYASMLYMAQHYGPESYLGRLEYWEQGARKSDPYGPAVLGFRLGRGRVGQMYRRGPFVLHMLRRLVGDEAFVEFTSTLATFADSREISTGDLVALATKVLGDDMGWFFDQWILRAGLPELEASWRVEGRRVLVTLRQAQEGPPLRLRVPVEVLGKRRKAQTHLVDLVERELVVELPLPGGEVRAIRLDPEREVLTASKKVRKE